LAASGNHVVKPMLALGPNLGQQILRERPGATLDLAPQLVQAGERFREPERELEALR
jgi:hypothetical protein